MMKAWIPSLSATDLLIDRAHRVPKPQFVQAKFSRDTLARVHFFQVKDAVLKASRKNLPLPDPFTPVTI